MKKVIYSDLDGTLFSYMNNEVYINEENKDAINMWRENNFFGIATGRNIEGLKKHFQEIELLSNTYHVLLNGSVVYDSISDLILFQDTIKKEIIDEFIKYQETRDDVLLTLVTPYSRYTLKDTTMNISYEKVDTTTLKYDEISKVTLIIDEKNYGRVTAELKKFSTYNDFDVVPSNYRFIEVVTKGVSKKTGIMHALKLKKIVDYELYSIGDHLNDIEMLQNSKLSFTPENGISEIKTFVDYIVSHHQESAVKDMINIIENKND